jgi:D-alanyl-D-alanine carboxypeptidase (penicillin-binding protein 5/6)
MKEMKKQKEKQMKLRKLFRIAIPAAGAVLVCIFLGRKLMVRTDSQAQLPELNEIYENAVEEEDTEELTEEVNSNNVAKAEFPERVETGISQVYSASLDSETVEIGDEVVSDYAIFIDCDSYTILGRKQERAIIDPASMTKILTILTAADYLNEDRLKDTFTMTIEITDYSYSHDCSSVGFSVGETVTVKDLLYGTILPSGGDAALGLATYIAGSQEAFVELMNDKLKELELSETAHVTNCIGLYDEEHYCTVYDMAMILAAAVDNPLCYEVLSAKTYTTSETEEHPEGITISNWFLRRIEDKDTGGEVVCAKTGYVLQSGNCAASYGLDENGRGYICVTAKSTSSWRCIYDHVALYQKFLTEM